jgi:hypothetical protein
MANEFAHVLPKWTARKGYKELDGLENEDNRRGISRFVLYTMALTAAGLFALGVISRYLHHSLEYHLSHPIQTASPITLQRHSYRDI